jgi:hypothetical protein
MKRGVFIFVFLMTVALAYAQQKPTGKWAEMKIPYNGKERYIGTCEYEKDIDCVTYTIWGYYCDTLLGVYPDEDGFAKYLGESYTDTPIIITAISRDGIPYLIVVRKTKDSFLAFWYDAGR